MVQPSPVPQPRSAWPLRALHRMRHCLPVSSLILLGPVPRPPLSGRPPSLTLQALRSWPNVLATIPSRKSQEVGRLACLPKAEARLRRLPAAYSRPVLSRRPALFRRHLRHVRQFHRQCLTLRPPDPSPRFPAPRSTRVGLLSLVSSGLASAHLVPSGTPLIDRGHNELDLPIIQENKHRSDSARAMDK
ncbi:hypothetical protein C8R43DRAFT_551843 [Mycena crocata]|nr:hypothetical protein C8R43DRAFT_551843 [Mycena crocata]